jgi:hypothetical protein
VRVQQACACTIVAVPGRMRIIHAPHPRRVKLLLIDQQIVSALRLAQ